KLTRSVSEGAFPRLRFGFSDLATSGVLSPSSKPSLLLAHGAARCRIHPNCMSVPSAVVGSGPVKGAGDERNPSVAVGGLPGGSAGRAGPAGAAEGGRSTRRRDHARK